MVRSNGVKTETSALSDIEDPVIIEEELESVQDALEDPVTIEEEPESVQDVQDIDDILNSLKSLLSTVDKLQKIRQEVGDIKPLIGRMLDGELLAGDELEQLKIGVTGMNRLVRAYSDHQAALAKAQPARKLLDQVLK
ncbi:MAG: hypothetical protein KME60_00760 [Cyanomargarita calcarea GSE-NOS-MK-12-04C]|jgi:hypothetical protein|uniref:Uncharacterized protein n=1 Tax=Cyanomargarita calcarea GSE-NOS-MK-12-04C TaxID=2839659 RepID=A0A951QJ52_9CYAN|nr:hypothetical protein [Cyanomargarita calcarea GSE-NOS-MK-12-04C]